MVARERLDYRLDQESFVVFGLPLGHLRKAFGEGIVGADRQEQCL